MELTGGEGGNGKDNLKDQDAVDGTSAFTEVEEDVQKTAASDAGAQETIADVLATPEDKQRLARILIKKQTSEVSPLLWERLVSEVGGLNETSVSQ